MTQETIKVFVGCDPNNSDLEQMMVLEYSIKKHTTAPVEIIWMQLSRDSTSFWYSDPENHEGWATIRWATPFSGFRWAIPAYCGYKGRAIYMDADVIVLSDLQAMWGHPIEGKAIVAAKAETKIINNETIARLCTCVWDCEKAKNYLPSLTEMQADERSHEKLMKLIRETPALVQPYNDSYNCVDGEDLLIEQIKVLHYSDMSTQFSHKYSISRLEAEGSQHWFDGEIMSHPRQDLIDLFDQYYQEALDAGYHVENYRIPSFGRIPKKSHKKYKGNKVTRGEKSNFWTRLLNR